MLIRGSLVKSRLLVDPPDNVTTLERYSSPMQARMKWRNYRLTTEKNQTTNLVGPFYLSAGS